MKPQLPDTRRAWLRLMLLVLGAYVLFCAVMAVDHRSFIYPAMPSTLIEPADAGLKHYTRHTLKAANNTITYWESSSTPQQPLLFYFHGNGGGLHTFVPALAFLQAQGFHVIGLEYRGYPGAEGRPTQTGIISDGLALIDALQQKYPGRPVIIWGYSLGSGVATHVAAQRNPAVLILEAPFTAVVDRAGELFPYLPVTWLMRDQYRSREVISKVGAPVLILHGEADYIIPAPHGKALYALAQPPKALNLYPEAGHLDLMDHGAYTDAITFIRNYVKN